MYATTQEIEQRRIILNQTLNALTEAKRVLRKKIIQIEDEIIVLQHLENFNIHRNTERPEQ